MNGLQVQGELWCMNSFAAIIIWMRFNLTDYIILCVLFSLNFLFIWPQKLLCATINSFRATPHLACPVFQQCWGETHISPRTFKARLVIVGGGNEEINLIYSVTFSEVQRITRVKRCDKFKHVYILNLIYKLARRRSWWQIRWKMQRSVEIINHCVFILE